MTALTGLPGLALLCAAALGGLREPWQWAVFSTLFLWLLLRRGSVAFPGRAAALYFLWLTAATAASPYGGPAFHGLAKYALPGLLLWWTAAGEGEEGWPRAVLLLGSFAAVVLLAQRLGGFGIYGFIGKNPNYSAVFCAASLALVAGRGGRAPARAALALLLAGGVAASGSRGAILASVVSCALVFAAGRRWRALGLLAAGCAASLALLPEGALSVMLKADVTHAFERPRLWGAALRAASDSPLLGWGPGTFGVVFETYKFPYFNGVSYYGHSTLHAHSEFLQLAAEAGFPALFFFLALAWKAMKAGFRKSPGLAGALTAALVQGGVDMIFYSGAVGLLFWGTAGYLCKGAAPVKPGRFVLAAGVACFAALVLAALTPSGAARSPARAPQGSVQALGISRLEALEKPNDPFAARRAALAASALGDYVSAEAGLRRALELEPYFAGARLDLARVYAASGARVPACAQLKLARRKAPGAAQPSLYDRALLDLDQNMADRMEGVLCRK